MYCVCVYDFLQKQQNVPPYKIVTKIKRQTQTSFFFKLPIKNLKIRIWQQNKTHNQENYSVNNIDRLPSCSKSYISPVRMLCSSSLLNQTLSESSVTSLECTH